MASREKFSPIVEKGWKGLVDRIDSNGDIDGVCEGTNMTNDRDFYLGRRTLPGTCTGRHRYYGVPQHFLKTD